MNNPHINRVCPHDQEEPDLYRQRCAQLNSRDIEADTSPYYVTVTFWIVDNLVTSDQVNQQLVALNNAFNGKLDPPAEFQSVAGNFNITFELGAINNVSTNESWGNLYDMWNFIGQNIISGHLNVYINEYTTENLLGQAAAENDPYNNVVTIRYDTLDTNPFSGMTLAHEVGHICGLPHPFNSNCGTSPFADIRTSKTPNYFAIADNQFNNNNLDNGAQEADFLEYWSQAAWDSIERPVSCDGDVPEQGVNIMDYALDFALLMFSKDQINYGRSEFGILSRSIDVRGAPATNNSTGVDPLSSSSSGWWIWIIVGISALFVIWLVYYFSIRKKSGK